ncbi:cysteine hydrolase family protein [Jannaschia pohangensis]|uniref:Nicotinamidase-related amidase n=1 Tax=Jannaschia pohangensis TaxID=390807 RepID=A0A1I3IX69_9RHOB|nr:cysteine hydrolase family protein [Jannaschia pohangensis]SFI52458.1 Nicotinamidase-related amidase [Jannaschia pohangensis]
MTQTALILIDIQNDYFEGGLWPVAGMAGATRIAASLLHRARATGQAILHVRHEILAPDAPFFRPGSTGADIHAEVAPITGEAVILKHRPNSFLGTDLGARLEAAGITDVTLAGAMSQMCIDATARAASDRGLTVTVVQDACAARAATFRGRDVSAADVHATIMAALSGSYARVVDFADLDGDTARG